MPDIFLDHIQTFEDLGARNSDGSAMTFRQMLTSYYPLLRGVMGRKRPLGHPIPAMPVGILPKYMARVNRGRWIIDCNHCNSALDVTPADTVAICIECGTEWFEVTFPFEKATIEHLLLKRPGNLREGFANSNWVPGESVADLRAENLAHGLEV